MDEQFYLKKLSDMTEEEWEALCDGCGKCCFRKVLTGRGKKTKVHFTRIACNLLDLKTGRCTDYENRFKKNPDCGHLTKKNLGRADWLPDTCAYKLLFYKQPLPPWHPLISGDAASVRRAGIFIPDAVHERDVPEEDWEDYEI